MPRNVDPSVKKRVNYQVRLHDRRKQLRVFHINMLRKWHQPQSENYLVQEVNESDEIPVWQEEGKSAPIIGDQLSNEQRQDVKELLTKFEKVFDEKPGQTTLELANIPLSGQGC